eukprot:2258347-Alexandrium_andersonii.AAC.1
MQHGNLHTLLMAVRMLLWTTGPALPSKQMHELYRSPPASMAEPKWMEPAVERAPTPPGRLRGARASAPPRTDATTARDTVLPAGALLDPDARASVDEDKHDKHARARSPNLHGPSS